MRLRSVPTALACLGTLWFAATVVSPVFGQGPPPGPGILAPPAQDPSLQVPPLAQAPRPQPPPPQPPTPPQRPAQIQPGQALADLLGRFRVTLPAGTIPSGASYNFVFPAAAAMVNIMSVPQDQMFQMQTGSFQGMLQQLKAKVTADQQSEVRGRPARFITATVPDPQTGTPMRSMNVFVPGPNVWLQVMGPEQNSSQLTEIMNLMLGSFQFQ